MGKHYTTLDVCGGAVTLRGITRDGDGLYGADNASVYAPLNGEDRRQLGRIESNYLVARNRAAFLGAALDQYRRELDDLAGKQADAELARVIQGVYLNDGSWEAAAIAAREHLTRETKG